MKKKILPLQTEFYQIHYRVYWGATVDDNKEKKYIKKFKRENSQDIEGSSFL